MAKGQRLRKISILISCTNKSNDRLMKMNETDSDGETGFEGFKSQSDYGAQIALLYDDGQCQCIKPMRKERQHWSWRPPGSSSSYVSRALLLVFLAAAVVQGDLTGGQALKETSHAADVMSPSTSVPEENIISATDTDSANSSRSHLNPSGKLQSRRNHKEPELTAGLLPGVSMNRNSLFNGDSVLQQQLRDKVRQDSLESIKMNILFRLNMKKLPNIPEPIAVPQTILDNFYKNHNTSKSFPQSKASSSSSSNGEFEEILADAMRSTSNASKGKERSENSTPSNASSEMQGDDPNAFDEFPFTYNIGLDSSHHQDSDFGTRVSRDYPINQDNGEYESVLSHISSIYVFPEQSHVRHYRKTDVLRFQFDTENSDISFMTLHLYLRGLEWITEHQPKILEEIANSENKNIVVAVHRPIRRANSTSYTHRAKIFEFEHKIPSGLGQWVNVDLTPLFTSSTSSNGIIGPGLNNTQEIFIKGVEPWMKPLVVTTDNTAKTPLTVHIEIGSRRKHRRKRSVFMDCTESDHEMRCCRYPLKVNFTSFGWHFVVAPTSFDAYFCSGDCRVGYLEQYPHTHLAALTTSAAPCCSPTKMSALSLLYFDDNHQLMLSVIPNMSVEGCSCS